MTQSPMIGEANVDTCTANILSICSGYGGIELGLHAALGGRTRTVCYVENELGVASILAARMEDGSLDPAPIWTDLRTFDPEPWRGQVDILAGGFPCQPHSVAGAQRGEDDPRELSGEVVRIAAGLGHPTLFLENVPGILRFYRDSIRPELRKMGYEVKEGLFTASETGAPHKRERLFILAHRDGEFGNIFQRAAWAKSYRSGKGVAHADIGPCIQCELQEGSEHNIRGGSELADAAGGRTGRQARLGERGEGRTGFDQRGGELADADHEGSQGWDKRRDSARECTAWKGGPELGELPLYPPGPGDHEGWAYMLSIMPAAQPTFCRDDNGTMSGVDRRLRAAGNGVIPAVAALAFAELGRAIERDGGKETRDDAIA